MNLSAARLFVPDLSMEERYVDRDENGKLINLRIYREDGLEEYWHFCQNGQAERQWSYRNRKLEGMYKEWYENGHLGMQEIYQNGKKEGKCKYWYGDGRIRESIFFRNGEIEGEYKFWHPNGHLKEQEFYLIGKCIDKNFNFSKKQVFLRIVQSSRKRAIEPLKMLIISDLMRMF